MSTADEGDKVAALKGLESWGPSQRWRKRMGQYFSINVNRTLISFPSGD